MSAIDDELAALEAEDEVASKSLDAERAEQAKIDRIAFLKLKKQHGDHKIECKQLGKWKPGFPTLVVVSSLDSSAYRRYEQMSQNKQERVRQQAQACAVSDSLLYPDEDTFAKMKAEYLDLPGVVCLEAVRLSQAKAAAEGKG